MFSSDQSHVVMIESVSGYPQLVTGRVSVTDTIPYTTLTQGHFEVTRIVDWDYNNNWM